jgi:hypothetical protein
MTSQPEHRTGGDGMTQIDEDGAKNSDLSEIRAWRCLLLAIAAPTIAGVWLLLSDDWQTPWRCIILFAGLIAASTAIVIRPTPSVFAGAGLSGFLAYRALDPEWDSARLLVAVLTALALAGAVVLLLPRPVRRILASIVILGHFTGIGVAVLSVHPSPWLADYLWSQGYHYYLEFMYAGNAYHFYSPEPGPATQLWAYVKYEDGTGQWFKTPRREMHPLAIEYTRRLSLTESISQVAVVSPTEARQRAYRRVQAGQIAGIPEHPLFPEALQFRPPSVYSRRMLESYARFLARTTPHPGGSDCKVTGVKFYRAVHRILTPQEIAADNDPWDRSIHDPYYLGEFDASGRLQDADSPFLYWLIPIVKEQDGRIVDYVERHVHLPTPDSRR